MIIYKNRCLSWTMPNINGKNKIQLNDLVVTPKGLKKITRVVCEATRFDIDGIGGSIAINEGGMDKLIYKSTKFQRIRYKYFFINTYSINK